MECKVGARPSSAAPLGGGRVRAVALAFLAVLLVGLAACGKTDSPAPDGAEGTTVPAETKPSCVNGQFPSDAFGSPKGLKVTGTGNAPGWYVWLAGPLLRVRLVSDPAAPLAPVPETVPPRSKKQKPEAVVLAYTGDLRATAALGKVNVIPDEGVGLVHESASQVTFALNGRTTPVGFDVTVPCGAKSLQVLLEIPEVGTPKPAGVDKIFIGRDSHPLNNPVVLTRIPNPETTTTTAEVKPIPAKPTTTAKPTATTAITAAP